MSHPPNRTNLPPAKSPEEYEREIETILASVGQVWKSAYNIGYADKSCGKKFEHSPNPYPLNVPNPLYRLESMMRVRETKDN